MGKLLYGKLNENLQCILGELIKSDELVRFLWYTNESGNILSPSLPNISDRDRVGLIQGDAKKIFKRKKVPKTNTPNDADCYISIRYTNIGRIQRNGRLLNMQVLSFYVFCHESLCDTLNGQRDMCLVEAIRRIFDDKNIVGIGKTSMPTIADLQTPDDFMGYVVTYEIPDFKE